MTSLTRRLLAIALLVWTAHAGAEPLDAVEADRLRIQEHLTRVERELRATDTSHLGPEQQRERRRNIERLRRYRERGVFPQNGDFPGERVPYFIDADGRTCAMAQLLIDSGAEPLARRIANKENNARLYDMQTAGLTDWVAKSGLTLDECARIQPSYCDRESHCQGDAGPVCGESGKSYWCLKLLLACSNDTYVHDGECIDSGAPPKADSGAADGGDVPPVVANDGGCRAGAGGEPGSVARLAAIGFLFVLRRRR